MKQLKIFLVFLLICLLKINSIPIKKEAPTTINSKATPQPPQRKSNDIVVEVPQTMEVVPNDVATLVELPVDHHTSISYYYPYFYKAHLISFHDEVDLTTLVTACADPRCGHCDPNLIDQCYKCETGFYLNGNTCEAYCPEGYVADILRNKCMEPAKVTTEVIYTMAYTVGSCSNMCGHVVHDCR